MGPGPVVILSTREIEKLRVAGRFAANLLKHLGEMVRPGITTQTLNDEAERLTKAKNGRSAPLNYKGFPRSICTSPNEVVCHGIPSKQVVLKEGDTVSIDVTPIIDGFYGDTCATFYVGKPSDEARHLVSSTLECLRRGIATIGGGSRLNEIGGAIHDYADAQKLSVVRDFVGHGVGRTFHGPPQVAHYRQRRAGLRLRPGMVFTVEPMINQGTWEVEVLEDGWTAVTLDRRLSAQFEHTILVTRDGVEIMTLADGDTFDLDV